MMSQQRSLTESQIQEAFSKFKRLAKKHNVSTLEQVQRKAKPDHVSYEFKSKTDSYSPPKIQIYKKQYCKNIENVTTIEISISGCSSCGGGHDAAEITSRKYGILDSVLNDAFSTWIGAYNEILKKDKKDVENKKNLRKLQKIFGKNKKKIKKPNGRSYTKHLLGKKEGYVRVDDEDNNYNTLDSKFEIKLENLSYFEMEHLSKILKPFLSKEALD